MKDSRMAQVSVVFIVKKTVYIDQLGEALPGTSIFTPYGKLWNKLNVAQSKPILANRVNGVIKWFNFMGG